MSEKFALRDRRAVEKGVSGAAKFAFDQLLLRFHNVRTDRCNPSYETLGASMGITDRAAKTLVKKLVGAGWVEIERRGRSTNNYRIVDLSRAGEEPRIFFRPDIHLVVSNDDVEVKVSSPNGNDASGEWVKVSALEGGRNLHVLEEGNFTAEGKETRPQNNLVNTPREQPSENPISLRKREIEEQDGFSVGKRTGLPTGLADRTSPEWKSTWRPIFIRIAGEYGFSEPDARMACHEEFVSHHKKRGLPSADWEEEIRSWCRKRQAIQSRSAASSSPGGRLNGSSHIPVELLDDDHPNRSSYIKLTLKPLAEEMGYDVQLGQWEETARALRIHWNWNANQTLPLKTALKDVLQERQRKGLIGKAVGRPIRRSAI